MRDVGAVSRRSKNPVQRRAHFVAVTSHGELRPFRQGGWLLTSWSTTRVSVWAHGNFALASSCDVAAMSGRRSLVAACLRQHGRAWDRERQISAWAGRSVRGRAAEGAPKAALAQFTSGWAAVQPRGIPGQCGRACRSTTPRAGTL